MTKQSFGSKLKIKQTTDSLEILIPNRSQSLSVHIALEIVVFVVLCVILKLWSFLEFDILVVYKDELITQSILILTMRMTIVWFCFYLAWWGIWSGLGQSRLRISSEKIQIRYELVKIGCYKKLTINRSDIIKLERAPCFYRDSEGGIKLDISIIRVWVGTKVVELYKNSNFFSSIDFKNGFIGYEEDFKQLMSILGAWLNLSNTTVANQKPKGSRVTILNTSNTLEILVPPRGFNTDLVFSLLFVIGWNYWGYLNYVKDPQVFQNQTWFSWLTFLELIWLYFNLRSIRYIGYSLFKNVRLRITPQKISLTHEISGIGAIKTQTAARKNIVDLEYSSPFCHIIHKGKDGTKQILIPAKINILAEEKTFELGKDYPLTPPELDWMISVLSKFLALPVTRK